MFNQISIIVQIDTLYTLDALSEGGKIILLIATILKLVLLKLFMVDFLQTSIYNP